MEKYIELAYRNGVIDAYIDAETEERLSNEYSKRQKNNILSNMLTDTDSAMTYLNRKKELRLVVKNEVEAFLGVSLDDIANNETINSSLVDNFNSLVGISKQNESQKVEQFRRAVKMFAESLNEASALEIATIYDPWVEGKHYSPGVFLTYGTNPVGDVQLYKVISEHTSQSDWIPSATPSLYMPLGLNANGYAIWSRPTGAHDAYSKGDIVEYNGTLYISLIDGNVYSPDEYTAGWAVYKV